MYWMLGPQNQGEAINDFREFVMNSKEIVFLDQTKQSKERDNIQSFF